MDYTGNTISKPVVGSEAELLSAAIKNGEGLVNEQAWVTIRRIVEGMNKEKNVCPARFK